MSISIDEALAYARELTARIRNLPEEDPSRSELEAELDDYRAEIRLARDRGRSLESLRRDLHHIDERMADLRRQRISAPFATPTFTVSDPEAYSVPINRAIDANNADTLASLEQRKRELETAISMTAAETEQGHRPKPQKFTR
jgi:hypothetical protein